MPRAPTDRSIRTVPSTLSLNRSRISQATVNQTRQTGFFTEIICVQLAGNYLGQVLAQTSDHQRRQLDRVKQAQGAYDAAGLAAPAISRLPDLRRIALPDDAYRTPGGIVFQQARAAVSAAASRHGVELQERLER